MIGAGLRRRVILTVAVLLWAAAGLAGTGALLRYKQTPGAAANGPARWPSATHVRLETQKPTLIMVAHPKCSCTRASVAELSRLMTRLQGRLLAKVLMVRPNGVGSDWDHTDLAQSAARIPGVEVVVDVAGQEAERFGALTSGQTYLYSPSGDLLFSGGITASRGHEGDNAGTSQIVDLVEQQGTSSSPLTTPVFGCDVLDPGASRTSAQARLQTK